MVPAILVDQLMMYLSYDLLVQLVSFHSIGLIVIELIRVAELFCRV